jgi:hypothetical protein
MAGFLQFAGWNTITAGPIIVDYGPKGCTSHWTLTCPTIGPLISYYEYIIQYGASGSFAGLDYGADGHTSAEVKQLTISYPGVIGGIHGIDELFFDQWELLSNEKTDTIFSNPLIVGAAGWMNDNDKVVLSRLARTGGKIDEAIASCNADYSAKSLPAPASGGAGGDAPYQFDTTSADPRSIQIALEVQKGQTEYENPTYVLRHTSYCSAGATYDSSVANVECIYTPSQLLSEVGHGWTYNLPPRLYSKIASIPTQIAPGTESKFYTWGWLKRITREPVLANFMVEVSPEYELALWSSLRYAKL